ncbi:MFS transporter [Streptomyces subrutilus]|uniref:MFS transporter n=1 Tax=Streptomyces subrutilus TaxID=36818 RepID=A0A1E5PL15_9ACTN|nr:MFS transporter [Streptomyces subrutilus]OEJ30224.1 hypothetical protein BGK67_01555 [Streptomyces subrutilus]
MHSTSAEPGVRTRRRLIAASLVSSFGDGLYVPLTMLFIYSLTGLSLTSIGAGLTVAGLCALAFMRVAGVLIDRFSGRRVLIGVLASRAAGFAAYPFADSYPAFLMVALVVAVGMWASSPSLHALIGEIAQGAELGVPVARLTLRGRRTRAAASGAVIFTLSFAAFAVLPQLTSGTSAVVAVLGVAVLYTVGELVHSAPSQNLSIQSAPDHLRGRYLSTYQLFWSVCRTIAPMLLGFLLDAGRWHLWTVLALLVLTGAATSGGDPLR